MPKQAQQQVQPQIQISYQTEVGAAVTYAINVNAGDTFGVIKQRNLRTLLPGVPRDQIQLSYNGQPVRDDQEVLQVVNSTPGQALPVVNVVKLRLALAQAPTQTWQPALRLRSQDLMVLLAEALTPNLTLPVASPVAPSRPDARPQPATILPGLDESDDAALAQAIAASLYEEPNLLEDETMQRIIEESREEFEIQQALEASLREISDSTEPPKPTEPAQPKESQKPSASSASRKRRAQTTKAAKRVKIETETPKTDATVAPVTPLFDASLVKIEKVEEPAVLCEAVSKPKILHLELSLFEGTEFDNMQAVPKPMDKHIRISVIPVKPIVMIEGVDIMASLKALKNEHGYQIVVCSKKNESSMSGFINRLQSLASRSGQDASILSELTIKADCTDQEITELMRANPVVITKETLSANLRQIMPRSVNLKP